MKTVYQIKRLGDGWYDFSGIPQDGLYIKIGALKCDTDRKALNQGRKILKRIGVPPFQREIVTLGIVDEAAENVSNL